MTSKVSNKKISPVMHNFMCGVKTKTKMAIIIGILHLAAAPAVIISLIASIYSKNPGDMVESFAVIGVITTAIAGFMGIFVAIDSFSCLHNKSVVDMRLSLPLTATQRFFSNFLSGFAVYIVPFLAVQVVSLLGMAYGFIFMEGRTFEKSVYRYDGIQYSEYTCHYFMQAMPILLKLILAGTLAMLMLYTVTVFVTVCCGSKFESIAYTILINIMIPLTIYLVFMSMFSELFGVYISDNILMIIMYTSPAGGILAAANWAMGGEISTVSMNYAVWAIAYFLITAGIGAGAFFLYRKRRAEQVSKPFVFKLIYHIISTAAIFCIYSVFYYEQTGIVPAILTTAIVYFILEFAAKRGFKKMWVSLIKYVGVMAASVFIIFIAQATEGFGMVTRVPNISQVKYVELDYGGFYVMFPLPYDYTENGRERSFIKIEDTENIETIISAHQSTVDSREDKISAGAGFEIYYHLKSGGTMVRRYTANAAAAEILGRIDLTEEYKTQVSEIYKNKILKGKDEYFYTFEHDTEYALKMESVLSATWYENDSKIRLNSLVDRNFFEQFAEAYAKDIMNITEENYYRSSAKNRYSFVLKNLSGSTYVIPESFVNTLELLEYFGFDILKKENASDYELSVYLKEAAESERLSIFTAKEVRKMLNVPEGMAVHGRYPRIYDDNQHNVKKVDKDVTELYRAAEPMNIVPDNGYIIYVFGQAWAIPEELNGEAERVYAGISGNDDVKHGENVDPFWLESTDENIIPQAYTEIYTEQYIYD